MLQFHEKSPPWSHLATYGRSGYVTSFLPFGASTSTAMRLNSGCPKPTTGNGSHLP